MHFRRPRAPPGRGGASVKDVANDFLNARRVLVEAGELPPRTWAGYQQVGDLVVARLGRSRPAEDAGPGLKKSAEEDPPPGQGEEGGQAVRRRGGRPRVGAARRAAAGHAPSDAAISATLTLGTSRDGAGWGGALGGRMLRSHFPCANFNLLCHGRYGAGRLERSDCSSRKSDCWPCAPGRITPPDSPPGKERSKAGTSFSTSL